MRILIVLSLFCFFACKSEKKSDKTEPITENNNSCRLTIDFINSRLAILEAEIDSMKKLSDDPGFQKELKIKDAILQLLKEKRDGIQKKCDSLK